jgi:phosphate-selective porin OprO and OprP
MPSLTATLSWTALFVGLGLTLSSGGVLSAQECPKPRDTVPANSVFTPADQTPDKDSGASAEKIDRVTVERMIQEALATEAAKKEAATAGEGKRDFGLRATWADGFVAQTTDEAFRVHLGGRLEYDNSWFTQDSQLLLGTSHTTRLQDGSLFRRARLRADGLLWGWIDFVTEVNFANIQEASNTDNQPVQIGSVGLTSFYLTFRELPGVGNVRVGHLKAPVGLERSTGSNALYYMERSSLYDAFLGPNNFQDGILVFDSYLDDRVTLAAAFTRIGKNTTQSFGFDAADGKYAGSVRLTGLPLYAEDGRALMHLGVGYQHQSLVDHKFDVASRPLLRAGSGTNPDTPSVLATDPFFTPHGGDIVDLEWAGIWGPFSLSAEYALTRATDVFSSFNGFTYSGPRGDVLYEGYYVEAGFFLTPGDYRRYDGKTGTWERTQPQTVVEWTKGSGWSGGLGAVQLVARFTYLDLVDGDPVLTSTSGGAQAGKQRDMTLGINWYLNAQVWIMVNYVWTHIDSVDSKASGNFQGFGTRVHIDF